MMSSDNWNSSGGDELKCKQINFSEMVDHKVSLENLESSYGLKGIPFLWLQSYLSERIQMAMSGNSRLKWAPVGLLLGLTLMGSVLGLLFFYAVHGPITSFAYNVQAYFR